MTELLEGTDVDPVAPNKQLWDRQAYLDLFSGNADYSIISPNAHYDFESLLPAAPDDVKTFTDADLVTTGDVSALSAPPVSSLIFTVGCHGGLSVDDVQLGMTSPELATLDWAQLNARGTNQYVAHTTYGYGDTEIIAYSERLAQLFAANIAAMTTTSPGAPASLGEAVRTAKQKYLASTLVLTPYDEKIMQSWTYYGLPMYTLGDIVETPQISLASEIGLTPLEVGTFDLARSVTGPVTFEDAKSNGVVPVSIDLAGSALQLNETDDGDYYSVDGNTIVAQYRPVQPLVDVPIDSTTKFGGFLITDLVSQDLGSGYAPFISRPMVDNSVDEGRIEALDGAFPATLQRIGEVGGTQRLLVAAGQYESNQRLFRQITGELLPRGVTGDDQAPRFIDVAGRTVQDFGTTGPAGRGVQFDIVTEDATRVVVVYREIGSDDWSGIELAGQAQSNGTKKWFASAPLSGPNAQVEFFAQSVDSAGNVGITSNKIENFLATSAVDQVDGLRFEYTGGSEAQSGGRFFASGATFEVRRGTTEVATPTNVSVDSGVPFLYEPAKDLTIVFDKDRIGEYEAGTLYLDAGAHVLFAEDQAGNRVYRFFIVDPTAPSVNIATGPVATNGDVNVTITARDSSSGVATITTAACPNGCPGGQFETFPDGTATLTFTSKGTGDTTISATATDKVGNESAQVDVPIDRTPPEVTISGGSSGWTNADFVEVTITATDSGSGVALINPSCTPTECTVIQPYTVGTDGRATTVVRATAEGVTTISATATDNASNTSPPVTTTASIDRTAPIPSAVAGGDTNRDGFYGAGETGSITFSCSDASASGIAVSGILRCELLDGATVVAFTTTGATTVYPIPGEQTGTKSFTVRATDNATNTSTTTPPTTASIDRAAPGAPTITVSPAGWTNAASVSVTITATDNGVSGIRSINPTCTPAVCLPQPLVINPNTGMATLQLSVQAVGVTNISATATDKAGNTSPASSSSVRIDRVAPTASLSTNGAPLTRGVDSIAFSCGDQLSGIKSCQLFEFGGSAPLASASPGSTSGSYPLPISATVGPRQFVVTAIDNADNSFTSNPREVFVGYKICLDYNPNAPKQSGSAYAVSVTLCDPLGPTTGVTLTALTVDGTVDPGPGAPGGSNPAYTFTLDNKGSYSYTIKTTDLARGVHYLYFTAAPVDRTTLTTPGQLQPLAMFATPFTLK